MTNFRKFLWLSCAVLCAGAISCSNKNTANPAGITPTGEVTETAKPIDAVLRANIIKGTLEAKTDDAWHKVSVDEPLTGVTELRASGKGAVIAVGDGDDTLWLRGGSSVRLARAKDGGVHIDVIAGQVRMNASSLPAYARARMSTVEFTGRDVIVHKPSAGANTALAFTSSQPSRARWSLELEGETQPAGIGVIEVGSGDTSARLELRSLSVKVETAGDYALTEVEHIFFNPTDARLEGTFRFPLPEGAMPLGLAMEINGRMMEGEIVEREKARKTYESIVDAMEDPALLEWQQGNRFKLRVFPIEAQSPKKVVFRYAAPLAPTLSGYEYVYATAAPDLQTEIPRFRLNFNGKQVADREAFVAGEDIVVPIEAAAVPTALREVIAQAPRAGDQATSAQAIGAYTAVRFQPDWSKLGQELDAAGGSRTVLAIVDTSRSALEAHDLALQTLELVLAELDASDRFLVMAADIGTQVHAPAFAAATPDATRAAVEFVRAIEPDGASDLGAAFERAGQVIASDGAKSVDIVYIGDATPTWGATDPTALRAVMDTAFAQTPVHAAIVGKGTSSRLWRQLTAGRAGRVAMPRKRIDARRFAFLVARSSETPRIENLRIAVDGEAIAFPNDAFSLYRGEDVVAVMRTPADKALPTKLDVTGQVRGKVFRQTVPVIQPASSRLIAQRWATRQIAELEADKADKENIVALSKDFGVMSKHTSLLVLESEEAYKQHGIERRRLLAQNSPTVTGGDLESLGGRDASLSPDHIQPGDPEIRIPAPADAQSVVVIFPFGDTKLATFDEDANAWITRFLIDKDTPDGKYMVLVQVTMADGSLKTYRLPYYVDTQAPAVNLTFKPRSRGGFVVTAKQVITSSEMSLLDDDSEPGKAEISAEQAKLVSDARRVELWLPSGKMLSLKRKGAGKFQRTWKISEALTESVTVRVVVTDEALNQSTFAVTVHPDGSSQLADAATPADQE